MVNARESQIKIMFKYNKDTIKMKYQQNDHDHLGSCFKFSPVVCSNYNTIFGSNKAETTDNKFAGNDNDDEPCRKTFEIDHTDHCRTYKQFIRQRIHKFTKVCNKIVFTGKVSVKPVCNACDHKQSQRNVTIGFSAPSGQKKYYKKRNNDHSCNCKFIRCIH